VLSAEDAPELAAEVPNRHVGAAGQGLDVQRLGILPVDPVADATQQREVAQVLRRGGSAGHLRDRATSRRSCPAPLASGPTPSPLWPSPLRLRPRPAVETYDMNFWRTTLEGVIGGG
jgi:hypothetical protein